MLFSFSLQLYDLSLIMQLLRTGASYLFIGTVASPFVDFFTNYVFDDVDYLKSLVVICAVDTALGFYQAVRTKTISGKGFGMIFRKIITYTSALVMSHVLVSFTVHGESYIVFGWLDTVVYSAIMVNEALSVLENISNITPGLIPDRLIKYFKNFDSFTGKSKEHEDNNKSDKANGGNTD